MTAEVPIRTPPPAELDAATARDHHPCDAADRSWTRVAADAALIARRMHDLTAAGRALHARGWIAANEGNLSCRLDSPRPAAARPDAERCTIDILCSATGVSKGHLRPEDFCVVRHEFGSRSDEAVRSSEVPGPLPADDGPTVEQIAGVRSVTSEVRMHLAIYDANPSIRAIVHAHPPFATAWAIGEAPVPPGILPEIDLFIGPEIPRAPFVVPGTWKFAETVRPHAARPEISAVLLTRHGLVTWGASVQQALWRTEIVESYLRGLTLSRQA